MRWSSSLDRIERAGVGFGLSIISPRGENEVYHWKACSYRNGILYVIFESGEDLDLRESTHCSGARNASVAVCGSFNERPNFPKGI